MTGEEVIAEFGTTLEQYPLYEHMTQSSQIKFGEALIDLAARDNPAEELDWEVLPPDQWMVNKAEPTVVADVPETAQEERKSRIPERIQDLEQIETEWKEQGYQTGRAIGFHRKNRELAYRVVIRIRQTEDGEILEDAVADSEHYPNAIYAIRGEHGNWRQLFQLTKREVFDFYEDLGIRGRFIHNGDYLQRIRNYIS